MTGDEPYEQGEDIIYCVANAGPLPASLTGRHRFLDVLWLPCQLGELRPEQTFVISRFRERQMGRDPQFRHADVSRKALLALIRDLRPKSVLEIGCGKYPLARDLAGVNYRGIEIDPEAIQDCKANGFSVGTLAELRDHERFDLVVSLYALHFAFDAVLAEYISQHMSESGCLIFNLIADASADVLSKLALLTEAMPSVRVIKEPVLTTKEFFFVMGPSNAAEAVSIISAKLITLLRD